MALPQPGSGRNPAGSIAAPSLEAGPARDASVAHVRALARGGWPAPGHRRRRFGPRVIDRTLRAGLHGGLEMRCGTEGLRAHRCPA